MDNWNVDCREFPVSNTFHYAYPYCVFDGHPNDVAVSVQYKHESHSIPTQENGFEVLNY